MEIRGVSKLNVGPVPATGSAKPTAGAPVNAAGELDQVQISPAAKYLDQYNALPAVRADKVAAARQSIADGTMDSDAKLSIAIDRLLDDLLSN